MVALPRDWQGFKYLKKNHTLFWGHQLSDHLVAGLAKKWHAGHLELKQPVCHTGKKKIESKPLVMNKR